MSGIFKQYNNVVNVR